MSNKLSKKHIMQPSRELRDMGVGESAYVRFVKCNQDGTVFLNPYSRLMESGHYASTRCFVVQRVEDDVWNVLIPKERLPLEASSGSVRGYICATKIELVD